MMDQQNYYVECDCGHNDHLFKFAWTEPDNYEPGTIYLAVQLNPRFGFFQRVWVACQYIFGHGSRFGHFDCSSMDHKAIKGLHGFLGACVAELEKDYRTRV